MVRALKILCYIFLVGNVGLSAYALYQLDVEDKHLEYVQSVFMPIMLEKSYTIGCIESHSDAATCRAKAEVYREEMTKMLKLQ